MVHYRTGGIRSLSLLVEMALVSLGYWIWVAVALPDIILNTDALFRYFFYNEVILVGLILGYGKKITIGSQIGRSWKAAHQQSVYQVMYSLFSLLFVLVAFKDIVISRFVLFGFVPLLYALSLVANFGVPSLLSRSLFQDEYSDRVILIGGETKLKEMTGWLESKKSLGLEIVGMLSASYQSESPSPPGCLGQMEQLEEVVHKHAITTVLVLEYSVSPRIISDCVRLCEGMGVRLLVMGDFEKAFQHAIVIFEEDGLRLIGLRHEPLENPLNRLLKRCLDVTVALPVVVLILPPLTVLVWMFQRIQSPGPVFYVQPRVGMLNRPFKILKFRTMHVHNDDPSRQVISHDERIYPFGCLLRKFSLDEIPQFWNVLEGEMSAIGPRPHLPQHDELFARVMNNYHVRAAIKPGITGLAQVNGFRGSTRCAEDIQGRVRADIHYLENWSLAMDCWILGKTIKQVIMPPATAR